MGNRNATGTGTNISAILASAEERQQDAERAAQLLDQAEEEFGVVVQDIPLQAIEPDPAQPRRVFDEEKLTSLAASIKKYGLLQEPAVIPVASDAAGLPTRFRLIWGERRWRACALAGLMRMRCKVLPRSDESAREKLRIREQQWAENAQREGLSVIEEAIAIQDAADLERVLSPTVPVGDLVEKIGTQRGLNGIVARNLVALLSTPQCLQSALASRGIGREVGFELARHWRKLLEQGEREGTLRREIKYRNLVRAWAEERRLELNAEAMQKYAGETFQDPKVVKATCRKAEEAERAVTERFRALVERAQKQKWTVAKARVVLASRSAHGGTEETPLLLFEQIGKAKPRLTIFLDRVRDAAVATPAARAELMALLEGLLADLKVAPIPEHEAPSSGKVEPATA